MVTNILILLFLPQTSLNIFFLKLDVVIYLPDSFDENLIMQIYKLIYMARAIDDFESVFSFFFFFNIRYNTNYIIYTHTVLCMYAKQVHIIRSILFNFTYELLYT